MIILIALAILWTPYVATRLLLRARNAGTPARAHPQPAGAEPPGGAETYTGSQDGPAWSELDDRQLTRLLTNSAPRTSTE